MQEILLSGLETITAIQQLRTPALDVFFQAVTLLGQEEFYLLALPIILWCADFHLGVRLSVAVLLSHYLNVIMKDWLAEPRPFVYNPAIQLFPAEGYSLPSNHAQSGLVFWLRLARWGGQGYWQVGAVLLVVLIGFSRVYLGVHFPTDILAGWLLGLLLFTGFNSVEQKLAAVLQAMKPWQQGSLACLMPLVFTILSPRKESVAVMAALSGAGIGLIIAKRFFLLSGTIPGNRLKLLGRTAVGLSGLIMIWGGLKMIFPWENQDHFLLFRYLRYWLAGIWLTLGAPGLFQLLGLNSDIFSLKSENNSLDKTKTLQ